MDALPTPRPRRFERAPWRRPRGTHEVADYLFRHHFDEVVLKLGRHPDTRGTSRPYRENLATEVLKRMLESQQVDRFTDGTVGLWIRLALLRHFNESGSAATRLSVTEDELGGGDTAQELSPEVRGLGLDGFTGSSDLEPEFSVVERERKLAALELRAQMSEELQQLFQLRWEQDVPPREIREHFGWTSKQYEGRDAKLKALVMTAVQQSAPDALVDGFGDGSTCRRTQELLPLVFRDGHAPRGASRARMDTHLKTCPACAVAARQAKRLVAETRPSFIPVGAPVGGGFVAGGSLFADLSAKAAALFGAGGAGAAATKVAGVAACAVACVIGGGALLKEPEAPASRTPAKPESAASPRVVPELAQRPASVTLATKPSSPPTTKERRPARASTTRRPRQTSKKRSARPSRTTSSPQRVAPTPAAGAPEFLPETPPAAPAPAPRAAPTPSSGDEFAGP